MQLVTNISDFFSLSANPIKWSNTLTLTIRRQLLLLSYCLKGEKFFPGNLRVRSVYFGNF